MLEGWLYQNLVTDNEVESDSIDAENWCKCIDGALTKENYMKSIRMAGFSDIEILDEKPYLETDAKKEGRRKITSLVIKAIKK